MSAVHKSGEIGRSAGTRGDAGAKGGEAFGEAFAQIGREHDGKKQAGRAPEVNESMQRIGKGEPHSANEPQPADLRPAGAAAGREQQPDLLPVEADGRASAEAATTAAPQDAKKGQPRGAGNADGRITPADRTGQAPLEILRRSDGRFELAELLGEKRQSSGIPARTPASPDVPAGDEAVEADPGGEAAEAGDPVPAERSVALRSEHVTPAPAAGGQAHTTPAHAVAAALSALSSGVAARGPKDGEGGAARAAAAVAGHQAATTPEGEGDDLFRFAQTDAKAEAVPGISSAERLRAALASMVREPGTEARQPAGGIEANAPEFSIVESRKFLGVATGQTAVASVVSAVTENSEWNAMLRDASATAATTLNTARNAANSLKIQLSPVELGTVTATLKMSGGHLSIELKVETMEAYRQLSSGEHNLVRALRGHGYDIDQVILHQPASGDRGQAATAAPAASNAQAGGSQFAGSSGGGSAEAGNGQQRGGDEGRGGQQHHQGERRGENGSMAGERNRPGGGVYL